MMLFSVLTTILILVVVTASGQSPARRIQTEGELANELCREGQDQQSRDLLLRANPSLVTNRLWRELITQAVAASNGPSPNKSLAIFDVAIDVARLLHSPKLLGTTYYRLGSTHSTLNQIPLAIDAYEKSRANFEQAGSRRDLIYILADLGTLYFILEQYQKAKDYSEQSVVLADKLKISDAPAGASPDDFGRARALQTLADISLRDGDETQAIANLETSLELFRQLNGKGTDYDYYIAGDLMALGRVYSAMDEYAKGLFYLNQALEIVKKLSDADMMSSLLNSIGFLYMEQEDYLQAKQYYERSLQGYLSEDNQRESARVLLNLGVIEQRQSHYDQALTRFKASLQAARETKIRDVEIASGEGIGVVLTAKREFAPALEALNQSFEIAKDAKDKTRQTEILWRSAETYYEMGKYDEAVSHVESAASLARASHLPKLTYLATTTLGQSYAAQKKFNLATQTLKDAVEQLEITRDRVAGREVESQLFFENKTVAYHALIDILVKQGRTLDALLYAERAKGRVLLDVLSKDKQGLAKLLTPAEKEETQRLNRKISEVNDRIKSQETANSASLNSLYSQLDAARLEYQSFQNALSVTHPGLSIRSGRTATIDSLGIDTLTRNTDNAYLEFVVGRDRVLMFVLTTNKSNAGIELKTYPLEITANDLVRMVDQFHDQLANLNPEYTANARKLYDLLVAPAAEQIKGADTLCIIPDGFLWNLPFQALMPANDRFLLEDHAIYYAPSLSVLREMAKKERGAGIRNSLIAFGNPVIGKDEQHQVDLCPLPEAENEVNTILKTLGLKQNKAFIGREASEKTFKAQGPDFSMIHLATHGVIDNRNPLYSHLLLTKSDGDPDNNGLLEARAIMNMNLDADLAVLSGCETANGKIAPGEGVIGLTWAFFIAGTRSVLVSQWKVNSASTSQLMANFYQNLAVKNQLGGEKARALRAGALRLMKGNNNRHPFFWAGFVLVGVN